MGLGVSFQKRLTPEKWGSPRLAVIKTERLEDGRLACVCTCGWFTAHSRERIREDRAERHLRKRHQNTGIFL